MTIWYDFTTTLRNTGRSGIANVEWSLGQALVASTAGVRSFSLDDRGRLVEVDAVRDLASTVYAGPSATSSVATVAPPTWRDVARRTLSTTLGPRAAPLIRAMSRAYQVPVRVGRAVRSGDLSTLRSSRRPAIDADVGSGDLVVSMGAVWEGDVAERLLDLKRRSGCVVATMVYDLVPLTHTHLAFHKEPELFERYYRGLIAASDLITCISEQSKRDLARFALDRGLDLPRTEVLHLGETVPSPPRPGEREQFFLCVGTIERRKNIELVYDALRILESEGHEVPTVVVAGALGWGVDDFVHELGVRSTRASRAMVLLGSVDDPTLDRLYRRARALLFPSLYEGWGLPVREAAVRGCPVAAGDSPAIREALAGYAGGTVLPIDDPGPWADYLRADRPNVSPAPVRTWNDAAAQLLGFLGGSG